MLRFVAILFTAVAILSCSSKGGDAAKAINAVSSAFTSQSSRSARAALEAHLKQRAEKVQVEQADSRNTTFTCAMFTGTQFCGGGGTTLEGDSDSITCTENSASGACNVACDGTGKTITAACGDETISVTDMKMSASFQAATCEDDGTNLAITSCVVFTEMGGKFSYGSLENSTLACGNADGSQKMCMTMTMPKDFTQVTSASAFSTQPSAESTIACTVDGESVEMDMDGGACGG